jgi:hypothetical protein
MGRFWRVKAWLGTVMALLAVSVLLVARPTLVLAASAPSGGWDQEYLFMYDSSTGISYINPAFDIPYGITPSNSACAPYEVYKVAAFDATDSYFGVIMDAGLPTGFLDILTGDQSSDPYFFPSQSTGDVESYLQDVADCYKYGYNSVSHIYTAELWLGFSNNNVSTAAEAEAAGEYAGEWVYDVSSLSGAWVDFEGGTTWSSEANMQTELNYYHSEESGGTWWDAGWFSAYWTYASLVDSGGYIPDVDNKYSEIDFLYPQNFDQSMEYCSGAYPDYPSDDTVSGQYGNESCTVESPWVGSYVLGITVDTGSTGPWTYFQDNDYPNGAGAEVIVVGAQASNINWADQ